jgi:uncharacterized membrane protein YebE (DUF533 family)
MASLSEVIGALMQSNPSKSTNLRLQKALGAGGPASSSNLASLLGGGVDEPLSSQFSGGIGNMLSGALDEASRLVGGQQNLALGGLGALAGALLGGGSGSLKGAVGGGVLAVLGAMAYSALQGTPQGAQEVPLGLREPTNTAEKEQLEGKAGLVLKAMINAAKADGQIDQGEVQRILGKLEEASIDQEARSLVLSEINKPMNTEAIVAATRGNPQLAVELYAASLLAIEVDTPAERTYLQNLANDFGLHPQAVNNIENTLGLQ